MRFCEQLLELGPFCGTEHLSRVLDYWAAFKTYGSEARSFQPQLRAGAIDFKNNITVK